MMTAYSVNRELSPAYRVFYSSLYFTFICIYSILFLAIHDCTAWWLWVPVPAKAALATFVAFVGFLHAPSALDVLPIVLSRTATCCADVY